MKKKREKVKGRAAAVIGMVLLIVCSIPLGMGVSLVRERSEVEEYYYDSLLRELSFCSSAAADFVTLGSKYLPSGDAQLEALREANGTLMSVQDPGEKGEAYVRLNGCMAALYRTLCDVQMTQQDEKYRESIYADYNSCVDIIGYNDYNMRAAKFNETFMNAPGRSIAEWMGVKELELFV